ncbi:hypothetical protein TUM17383_26970 [Shewanella algae]|nr:hypothetical protein TUM17383_26970 [Shewanella algae]
MLLAVMSLKRHNSGILQGYLVLALTKLGNPKHIQPTKTRNPAMAGFLLFRMCLSLISARPERLPGQFDWP